jgi:hypothetical protein
MTFSITAISKIGVSTILSISDTQHNSFLFKCHWAEIRYAECRDLNIVMLNVVMLSAIILVVVEPRTLNTVPLISFLPGLGFKPGNFWFFKHFLYLTLPLSYSGSPKYCFLGYRYHFQFSKDNKKIFYLPFTLMIICN